ncbi:DNA -binding domain-containing protein [Novosphingobium sp. YAF33]|uniref:DNA -binding domain-containing protein n=1 Tax=Novosphingobium sp. YAF33 TaxID=3233082 RepID=UPI003F9AB34E
MLPLRRLLALCDNRRFAVSLFPGDPKMGRFIDMLRVHDGLIAGASLSDLAEVLYGTAVGDAKARRSDSLRSRVRRLVREARAMAAGGYRDLMRG